MRILRVKLQNLNSLRGAHEVDFTTPPLVSCGLFAITGVTGAGKSTLLDAITLALFGKAARYDNDANPVDMMSRHTGQCQAEVLFQTKSGTYRAEWQLHRSRKSPEGAPQSPKRFVYDSNEIPLNRNPRECQQIIDSLLGLDYQRFLRSVLLAQGEFARFLKADPNARAELLESLTGTEIYAELGRVAHSIAMDKERACNEWRNAISAFSILTEEERTGLFQAIADTTQKIQSGIAQMDQQREKIAHLNAIEQATRELMQTEMAWIAWQKEDESFLLKREIIATHHQALAAQEGILRLRDASSRLKSATAQREIENKAYQVANDEWSRRLAQSNFFADTLSHEVRQRITSTRIAISSAERHKQDQQSWLLAHPHLSTLSHHIHDLLEMHQKIKSNQAIHRLCLEDVTKLTEEITKCSQTILQLQSESEQSVRLLEEENRQRLEIHEKMASYNSGKQQRPAETLAFLQQEIAICDSSIRMIDDVNIAEANKKKCTEEMQLLHAEIHQLIESLKAAVHERNLREDHFLLAKSAASIDEHRKHLQEGKPCPLCGSETHPWLGEHSPPSLSFVEDAYRKADQSWQELQAELIRKQSHTVSLEQSIIALDESITKWLGSRTCTRSREEFLQAKSALARKTNEFVTLMSALTEAEKKCNNIHTQHQQASIRINELESQVHLGNENVSQQQQKAIELQQQITSMVSTLEEKLLAFQLVNDQPTQWKKAAEVYQTSEINLQSAELRIAQLEQQLREDQTVFEEINQLTAAWRDEETAAVISYPPEWLSLGDVKTALRNAHDKKQHHGQRTEWCITTQKQCQRDLTLATEELEKQSITLGFASVDHIVSALLEHQEFNHFTALLHDHDVQKTRLLTSLTDAASRRNGLLKQQDNCGMLASDIQESLHELQLQHAGFIEELSLAKDRLARDETIRSQQAQSIAQLASMENELSHWQLMRELIGSHDGAKFRRFAQSISLDQLLHLANQHMRKLHPRYSMRRSAHGELHLEIIDHHQNNVARPMNSLSGGESFLGSLALALALSDIAGKKQSIETMFIDEGFGSLDSDALDAAISTLESLQQRGKTIGVISHIEMLKERIRVQIHVEKNSSGHSNILLKH